MYATLYNKLEDTTYRAEICANAAYIIKISRGITLKWILDLDKRGIQPSLVQDMANYLLLSKESTS